MAFQEYPKMVYPVGKDPVIVQPAQREAPAYEVQITSRDGNSRTRSMTFKPVKG